MKRLLLLFIIAVFSLWYGIILSCQRIDARLGFLFSTIVQESHQGNGGIYMYGSGSRRYVLSDCHMAPLYYNFRERITNKTDLI